MKPLDQYSISVVIPAFNEEDTIDKCVTSLEQALRSITKDFEIIVVNDASKDRTGEILENLKTTRNYLKVAHHQVNRKLGGTLRTAFSLCTKELVFYSDADLPFDFAELARAVRVLDLKNAGLVTGFRHDRTSEGSIRILYSLGYNCLIRWLFRIYIRDINFSFKLIRRSILEKLDLKSEGSFIDAEMVIKAGKLNTFICQIGIDYFKRNEGVSTLSGPGIIIKIFQEMMEQMPELRRFPNK